MSTIDKKIDDLFAILQAKKQEVEVAEKNVKRSWKTNCSFSVPLTNSSVNIQTANVQTVQSALASLIMYRSSLKEANKILDLQDDKKYLAYSFDDWIDDFQKRVSAIGIKAKKEELEKLEERLNSIVSPEQKRLMELEAITKSLGA